MLGSIIGAGVGLGTSLWGGISAGKNRKRQKKAINNAITDNQSWYDANYNADVLQRADAQRQISQLRDMMSNRRKYNNNLSAITGATQEAQLANQEADNKALTDVSRDMYARGQQYKDNIMNAYLNRKDRLNNSMYNLYDQRASSGENLMNTGLNFMEKSLSSGDIFKKIKSRHMDNNNELGLIDLIFDRHAKKFIASHDNEPEQSDNDTPTEVIADDNVVTSGTQQLYPSTPSTRGDNTPLPTNNNVSEVIADDNNTSKSNYYGIPKDKYERLAKHFTPEEIEYFYNFNPQNDNFLTELYNKTVEKPSPPDEKQIKRNRLWGIIGEGLGLVSQVASHGSGAYMRERQPTAIDAIDKRQQQLYDLYLKQRDRYEQGLFNAGQQDYLRNLQMRMRGRQQADALYNNQLKLEQEQEKARQALEYKLSKDADAMKFKEKELEERKRANRANEGDKAERRRMYNDRYISGGGAAANKNQKRIDIKAHENDNSINTYNNAVTGEKSRFFNLNESQVTQLATEARRDDEFVEKHQNVLNRMNFDGMTTWDKDNIIATAYAQWLYDKLASQGIIVDDNFNRRSIKNENINSYSGRPYLINNEGKFGGWVDEQEGGTTITEDEVKQASQESEEAQQQQESVGSSRVESQVQDTIPAAKSVVVKPDNRVIANDNSSSNSNQSNNSDKSEKEDVKITDNEPATTGDEWIDELVIGEIDAMDLIE